MEEVSPPPLPRAPAPAARVPKGPPLPPLSLPLLRADETLQTIALDRLTGDLQQVQHVRVIVAPVLILMNVALFCAALEN